MATPQTPKQSAKPAAAAPPRPAGAVAAGDESGQQSMQAKAQNSSGGDGDGEEEEYEYEESGAFMDFLRTTPSWIASGVFHMVLLIVMALITWSSVKKEQMALQAPEPEDQTETLDNLEDPIDDEEINVEPEELEFQPPTDKIEEEVRPDPIDDDSAAQATLVPDPLGTMPVPPGDFNPNGAMTGNATSGRGDPARRAALVAGGGGTKGSEDAVALALKWLANHQMKDGGWNFDHREGQCQGRCEDEGAASQARNGATAMALLPFLGAGHTHKESKKYKGVVRAGLAFLGKNIKDSGSMHEPQGTMYSHGLAAITLAEAYAMTRDRKLFDAAQRSIDFISEAQDPVGGGWRYNPKQAGDTSVVGWQIMALKSAHMSYLTINPNTIKGAEKFLDSVQTESGAFYGYTHPGKGSATTAIGLLCRMYMGWKRSNPALERGAQFLSKTGPSKNMYYNYYATQVMRHFDGPMWEKWNEQMRPMLVESQSQKGHSAGSWYFGGADHGSARGGRLYTTSMATMILEVYYRHLPLYQKAASDDEFPES